MRFCAVDYSLDDLNDKFIHLANNSIAKNSDAFKTSQIKGNMWHSDDFIEHLKQETGTEDTWYKNIQPRKRETQRESFLKKNRSATKQQMR